MTCEKAKYNIPEESIAGEWRRKGQEAQELISKKQKKTI